MADALPTSDDFFGRSDPNGLPSADEFFTAPAPSAIGTAVQAGGALLHGNIPAATQAVDDYFHKAPVGRVLDAFGQGAKQGWGSEPIGLSEETQAFLRKSGFFNDYNSGRESILKSANEALYRPAAAAIDAGLRGVGAVLGGAEAGVAQAGKEAGAPALGQEAAGVIEYAGQTGIPELAGAPHAPAVELPRARSLGVIGEGEGGYFGTKAPTPVSEAARAEAVKQTIQTAAEQPEAVGSAPETAPEAATTPEVAEPAVAQPDIHAVARQIAPDTFQEYDNLTQRQDTFRRWIQELDEKRTQDAETNAPHGDEISDLQSRIDDPDTTKRLAKKYSDRIETLQSERDSYIDQNTQGDTPDMARIRQELMSTDYRMRDLAPDVSAAYRQAQERVGTAPSSEPLAPAAEPVSEAASQQNPAPAVTEPVQGTEAPNVAGEPVSGGATQEHFDSIAGDVSKKLAGAGRPKGEADAAGQLIAAHYESRAQRFNGEKGNAYQLYAHEAPNIRVGGQAKPKELERAQRTLDQAKRGSFTISKARSTIRLFKDADASTFIHETGHSWLEELVRDAKDDAAKEDVKADAQTVKDWLGVKEGEDISTRQHEKFARGFERYMMEGVAPSPKLASVFAKFKEWLTKIYQTVAKLRSPINDDIRGVFDRLLSANPEKATIAPEREMSRQMADFHEEEAENTPPEQADAKADQIESDVDNAVKKAAPEVHDELPHKQIGTVPRENPSADRGGDETEPVAGAEGSIAERGEVAESGNEAQAEGGELRAEPGAGSRNGTGKRAATGEPNAANERFADTESDLVDKAGNIRLDNLSTPEDVNEVIRETARTNDNFAANRRGVLSDGEVLDLADAIGMDASMLDAVKIGQAFNAEQIIAARKLLIKSATNVRNLMAKAATGSDQDLMAYAAAKDQHIMIQRTVAQVTAEAGRALRAFRKLEGQEGADALGQFLGENDAKTLFQLKQEAKLGATLQTPQQVSRFMNDSTKGTFKRMVLEYYVNDLISGPITHLRYSVGNALNALWTPLVEIPTAAAIGGVRRVLGVGSDAQKVYLGEAGAQLFSLTKGSRDGWTAAYEAFRSGASPYLPEERISPNAVTGNAIPGVIGKVINIPSRSVSAIHSFFKTLRYEQNLQGLAYRTAMEEGRTGTDFQNRIAELTITPTPDMMDDAGRLDESKVDPAYLKNVQGSTEAALKELYMAPTDYHSSMGKLTNAVNQNFVAKLVIPFMKIGSQITRNAFIERTPLGIFDKDVRANILGANGDAARDMQLGKIAAGTALAGITVGLASEGLVTGDGPEDPQQRNIWLMSHRPNTIQVGEISIPFQGLGSLGMLMRFSANMYQVGTEIGHDDMGKVAVAFLEGASKSVLDENFMRGVKDLLDAVYHPQEYGPSYVKGFVTNWLPFSVGMSQMAHQIDPVMRDTSDSNVVDAIFKEAKSKIPFLSEELAPRRGIFGEPIPAGYDNAAYHDDPVIQALDNVKLYPGRLTKKIRGVQLSEEQYDDYSRVAGRMTRMQLNQIVGLPGFSALPDYERFALMQHAIEGSRESARSLTLMQNPELIQEAIRAKIAKVKGSNVP